MYLLVPLLVLLLIGYVNEVHTAHALSLERGGLWRSPIVRATITFALLIALPWLFVHRSPFGGSFHNDEGFLWIASVGIAFLISYTWYRYLTWLDVFERERLGSEVLVFILGCASALLALKAYPVWHAVTGLRLTGKAWDDWWYSVLVIGLIEEVVKLIPFLVIWRLTRQVNEPYDFILYASISALGFAFVENIGYLHISGLGSVLGRAVMASVAHMLDASIVAYGLAISVHRGRKQLFPRLLFYLLIAATAHGFYDFWLMGEGRPRILTVLFFVGSLQLWVIMMNNLVNISPHFVHAARPASAMFRYRIINGLLFILAAAYVAVFLWHDRAAADALVLSNASAMGALLLLVAINFSSYALIPGYVAPLRLPPSIFQWFIPRVEWETDLTGVRLMIAPHPGLLRAGRSMTLNRALPIEGLVERRVVVGDETNWYLFHPDRPLNMGGPVELLLMQLHRYYDTLDADHPAVVRLAGTTKPSGPVQVMWERKELVLLGSAIARSIRVLDPRS